MFIDEIKELTKYGEVEQMKQFQIAVLKQRDEIIQLIKKEAMLGYHRCLVSRVFNDNIKYFIDEGFKVKPNPFNSWDTYISWW